jgi:LysM repeat protein
MRRNYRLILSIIVVLLSGAFAFGQEAEFKDVILDGKPAKLNVNTGEITLVNPEDKIKSVELSDAVESSNKATNDSRISDKYSDFHTVKEKETLLDIANRYNTTLTELKRLNNLETTLVNVGQKLQVRAITNYGDQLTDIASESGNDAIAENSSNSESINDSVSEYSSNANMTQNGSYENYSGQVEYIKSTTDYHLVQKGQTLYSLAKLYETTVDELKYQNGLNSNLIITGEELRIANFDSHNSQGDLSVWVVSEGDTLYSIAKNNGTTVEELKYLNNLPDNLIIVGQKLKLK